MLVDIHIMKEDGTPGRLHDTIDLPYVALKEGVKVDYNGRKYKLLTGIRAMIVVPRECLRNA